MCSSKALAHWSHKLKNSLFTKHTPFSVPMCKQTPYAPSLPCERTSNPKVRHTHRDHLHNYNFGMLQVQILVFKLPVLSMSCEVEVKEGMMNEQAGLDSGLAVWGKCKVREKQDNWLWGITQITQKAKGSRKRTQPQLTRKMSKKMEKGAKRNITSQTPAWEPKDMEGRKMQTRWRAKWRNLSWVNNMKKGKSLAKKAGGKKKREKVIYGKKWEKTLYSLNTGTQLKFQDFYNCLWLTSNCANLWQSRHLMSLVFVRHGVTSTVSPSAWSDRLPALKFCSRDASVCLSAISHRKENLSSQQTWPASTTLAVH